jgi:hypothetical protein
VLLVTLVLAGVSAGAAGSATPLASQSPLPAASVAPELRSLEQKTEQLDINSERYSQTIQGTALVSGSGRRRGRRGTRTTRHSKHVSVTITENGEASLSPDEGELAEPRRTRTPLVVAIGSSIYDYTPSVAARDGGRPWVRFDLPAGSGGGGLFPFHAQPREVNAGGAGPYAGLINLLATAVGAVADAGPATVDGQQTTEFTATVEPARLIGGRSAKQLGALERELPPERLDVFLAESGLPVRVITTMGSGAGATTDTTDILAVNVPVSVTRPPASRTISAAALSKLPESKQ